MPHLGQYRSQHHGRAQRLQGILSRDQEGRRRVAADALQRRQHLGHDRRAVFQRLPQRLLAHVERPQPLLRVGHLRLHGADARRRVDQLLVELTAIVADRFDLALELGLRLDRLFLLGLDGFEILAVLLQGFEPRRRLGGPSRGLRWRCRVDGPEWQIGNFPGRSGGGLRGCARQPKREHAHRRQQGGAEGDRSGHGTAHMAGTFKGTWVPRPGKTRPASLPASLHRNAYAQTILGKNRSRAD